jgi:hypothetical protein
MDSASDSARIEAQVTPRPGFQEGWNFKLLLFPVFEESYVCDYCLSCIGGAKEPEFVLTLVRLFENISAFNLFDLSLKFIALIKVVIQD